MRIRVDPRGMARLGGTLTYEDLEPLPRHKRDLSPSVRRARAYRYRHVDRRPIQRCRGAPRRRPARPTTAGWWPRIATTSDEEVQELMHPQVMLAWLLNGEPIPPETRGAPPARHAVPLRCPVAQGDHRDPLRLAGPALRAPSPPGLDLVRPGQRAGARSEASDGIGERSRSGCPQGACHRRRAISRR